MRRTTFIAAGLALWATTAAAQFVGPGGVIPVVANIPGEAGSFWRSDVSVLNLNDHDVSIILMLQPEIRNGEPTFEPMVTESMTIPANQQLTMANVVQTEFGLVNKKGALSVLSLDGSPLAMSSRTYTFDADGGSYGQDIHSAIAAREAWVPGIRHDGFFRTNVGVFLPLAPLPGASVVFTITVYDADGTMAGSGTLTFPEAGVVQKSLEFFGVDTLVDGYVVVTCSDPSVAWYGYGSVVDWTTQDAVYHAARGRQGDLP